MSISKRSAHSNPLNNLYCLAAARIRQEMCEQCTGWKDFARAQEAARER